MDWAALISYWPFVAGLLVTGVCSGLAAGLLGIGGGAIIVPALSTALSLLGYDSDVVQHVAVGTSLAIIIPTGIMSARAHQARGALDLPTLRLLTRPADAIRAQAQALLPAIAAAVVRQSPRHGIASQPSTGRRCHRRPETATRPTRRQDRWPRR